MSNLAAFLRVIREGESSQTDEAYRMIVGGGRFHDFSDHPRQMVFIPSLNVNSTAAGAYQFLSRTWDECKSSLGLPDFSPESQDKAAVFLIRRRKALDDVTAGRIKEALQKCAKEWASLPGSPYGQPTLTMDRALEVYQRYGGTFGPQEERSEMAPFVIPAVIELAKMIPKLGGMFGGSEVAQRNVKAAEVVIDAVTSAVGAANAQEAVEKVQSDPTAKAAADKAVESVWYQITEGGGGGVDGARKADAAMADGSILKSPSFWIALFLLPLVYLLVLSLIGMIGTASWSDDVRAGLAGSLISAIVGGLVGYYYGQTTSRNRTPS